MDTATTVGDMPRRGRTARDRHGRGLRRPLLPPHVPGFRSRADMFDAAVTQAVADLEPRWPGQLEQIEFAVDDVPPAVADPAALGPETVTDAGVPLSRFNAPGVDARGRATKARVLVYRRPLEMRVANPADLVELVTEVVAEQLTAVLGDGAE